MIRIIAFSFALLAAACGSKSAPAQSTPAPAVTEPAPAGSDSSMPAGDGSGSAATTPPAGASNKCTTSGGHCLNKMSTYACAKFEEGAQWGCGQNEGCCINK